MRLSLTALSAIVAVAAAALQLSDKQCITTIGLPGGCCPPHSAVSETVLIDCKGCSLTSVTTGIHCMIVCPTPAPVEPGTTTVTSCKSSSTCTEDATPTSAPQGFVACTKTITTSLPWQCTVTKPAHTKTYSSDCSCCDLTTKTISPSVAARCRNSPTTVLNRKATKTETVCKTSTSCSIFW